jgi:hypothetical protein
LHRLFLRSRERAAAVKREKNTCQRCKRKGSTAKGKELKIQVHHKDGIGNWNKVIDMIFEEILCHPDKLEVLCVDDHDKEHQEKE